MVILVKIQWNNVENGQIIGKFDLTLFDVWNINFVGRESIIGKYK